MGLAIVFSGQGNQYPTMFNKFAAELNSRAPVMKQLAGVHNYKETNHFGKDIKFISHFLKIDILPTINLDSKQLFSNQCSQPIIASHGFLIWSYLKDYLPKPVAMAGYSLGELTAIAASANFDLSVILELTVARAKFMLEAAATAPSRLVAIRGVGIEHLKIICQENNCYIAIINAPGQCIIGGKIDDLAKCEDCIKRLPGQIKLTALNVGVASHTPLLATASSNFASYLLKYSKSILQNRIVSGVNANVQYKLQDALGLLACQISHTINFEMVVQVLFELGADVILEIGPGNALSKIIHEQNPAIKTKSIDDFNNLLEVISWINKYTN